ncbi:7-cyano-7-deazaguanine synthase [Clostridium sporogenes]|uniref:7-cyano-7-deazaguanine synthase n=1 Tax=Clostridium sporogenes TaxID=1509 RepID=UPI00223764A1|nr:7-cyano-7-deazaguanine synthase [Clostridium sporogenes]MCW6109109.1 7-cyano-7-deazaguanine synthase [Clostridium sporogenes]
MNNQALCKVCLLPLPTNKNGELLGNSNVCPACARKEKLKENVDWDLKKKEFENEIEKIRGKGDYDGLVMLSGGKDSVYVAYLLTQVYKLKIVALTIDNGFEYNNTFENSSSIAKKLSFSHYIYRLSKDEMREYYKFLLTNESLRQKDCSQLCFFCGRLLKSIAIKVAKQLNVAAVFSGHQTEQIRALGEENGNDPSFQIRKRYIKTYTTNNYNKAIQSLKDSGKSSIIHLFEDNIEVNKFEHCIYPLQYFDYKPLEITSLLEKEIGWRPDTNFTKKYISSGCRMAKIMEYVACKNGADTYVKREFNDQIRRGSISKEDYEEIVSGIVENKDEKEEILNMLNIKESELF